MKTIVQRTLLAFVLAAAGSAFGAEAIAFITNLKGEIAVDGNPRPLLLAEISKGQTITVGKESQASLMYIASGKEYVLRAPGEYLVKDTEVASASGMPPVARSTEWRASGKVLAQVAQTSAASVRMRSIGPAKAQATKKSSPVDGNVATLQPVFRWSAPPRAAVEFTLRIIAGQEKPVHRAKASGDGYALPVKLKPDTAYAWSATSAGNEIGYGEFRTLSAPALELIEKRRPSERSEFSDRLLFALLLQELGAVQEAQESWSRLAAERSDLPELSALAR